jgi:hypothetical protein
MAKTLKIAVIENADTVKVLLQGIIFEKTKFLLLIVFYIAFKISTKKKEIASLEWGSELKSVKRRVGFSNQKCNKE